MRTRFVKRTEAAPWWVSLMVPLLAILSSFMITSPLVLAAGASPLEAFYFLAISPLLSRFTLLEILVEALPLILTGLAFSIAFTAKYSNIGGEGQLYAGAIAAAWAGVALGKLPGIILIPIILALGFAAGALWSFLCRALKLTRARVSEVISTLLFNWVMIHLVGALLGGPWLDPVSKWPKSPEISETAHLPILILRSRVNLGLVVALLSVVAIYWILKRTALGFEAQAVGAGSRAAKSQGIDERRVITKIALISGGLAGLAGVMLVCGISYHLIKGISADYGYVGIAVAALGGFSPWGTLLSALFFGVLNVGKQTMQRMTQTPAPLADFAQNVMLLATVVMSKLSTHRIQFRGGGG